MRGRDNPIWTPSPEFDAQSAHVGWAIAIVMVFAPRFGIISATVLLLAWVLPKEFIFDIIIEEDSWSDSAVDAGFYLIGGIIGGLLFYLWPVLR